MSASRHSLNEVRRELDKIRAFALASFEALGGADFDPVDDDMVGDSHRKQAIATVKPLLELAVNHCNCLDDLIAEGAGEAPHAAAGGGR